MTDEKTVSFYNRNVLNYTNLIKKLPDHKSLDRFLSFLTKKSKIMDLGCGIGNYSNYMQENGMIVECIDASEEMIKTARNTFNLNANVLTFLEFNEINKFDALWANFSLLHSSKKDFVYHIKSIYKSLKLGGIFYLGLKLGKGQRRDKLGRLYSYYTEDEISKILDSERFKILEKTFGSNIGMVGQKEPWIGIFSKKIK